MANGKQQQYPVRLDISQPGAATAAPPVGALRRAGLAAGPAIEAAARNAPPVLAVQGLRRGMVAGQGGAADLVEGLLGLDAGTLPRAANTRLNPDYVRPKQAAATKTAPIKAEATPRSRPASEGITTTPATNKQSDQDVISSAVRNLLAGPFSRNDLRLAAAAMPAPAKPLTPKDMLTSEYAALTQGMFNAEMAKAQQLAASGDAEGAAAMELSAAEKLQRNWGAVLFNPQNIELAEKLQNVSAD